jgi:hypothetical protein
MTGIYVIIVVGALALGALWWFQVHLKQQRIANLVQVAHDLGFDFATDDPHGTVGLPFSFFTRGDDRGVEHVMWGTRNDIPMRLFDYWFYDEQTDSQGKRSRNYQRFTCLAMTIAADVPPIRIGPENVLSRIGAALGFKDVQLEYDDFNREYRVKCDDQQFAFSLLDGRMMEWLLGVDGIATLEMVGPFVLLATNKLASEDWTKLVGVGEQFYAHVPRVVWSTWPRVSS